MRFGILGPTELRDGETKIPLGATKQRGLLALLLLHAGRPVRIDTLVDHLWPGGGTDSRQKVIYSMVSRLRAVLGRTGVRHALTKVGGAYRLDVDPLCVDVHEFRALVERSRKAVTGDQSAAAIADLRRAVNLWRGESLEDLRGPAAEHLRRQLSEDLVEANRLLATGLLRIGQHDAVLVQLAGLVNEEKLDESLARLWTTALCAADREDDARRYLAAFRKRFRRELHMDPKIDFDAILSGRPQPAAECPHQLPYGIPGFVGRAEVLTELDRLAEPAAGRNVVVITGMPGIGKTTLAIHWAQRQLARFPDGQLYADGGAFGPAGPIDPKEVLARFLHAFGVPAERIPEGLEDRRHKFNDTLAGRRVLVVLDNIADSTQARPLIPGAPTCLTVITSRCRLSGLTVREGGHNLAISPLAEAEAGELLTQIVGERRVTAEPAAAGRMTGIAGGVPLALRIVGEQIAERPRTRIADLVCELQEKLLWAPTDEEDLCTVFDWSYRALPADAATLFRRLALHPGTRISLDAAVALCGTGLRETERALNLLARVNLIEHDTARHYRMHDLLRQYAGACGEEVDTPAEISILRRTIATWFLRSATNAAAVLAPQLPAVPDLPAAGPHVMEFATEAAAFSWCQSERENLGLMARSAARHGMHRHAWQIPAAIHEIFTRTGRYDDLLELNRLGAESALIDGHKFGEIANLSNHGYACHATHQYDLAVTMLTAAHARAAESGDKATENACAHNLATAFLSVGRTALAIDMLEDVRAAARRLGNRFSESAALHRLGDAYRREGQAERALAAYGAALTIRRDLGWTRWQALTHHEVSRLHLERGDLRLAARHCTAALALHDRVEEAAGFCDSMITKADIDLVAGGASAVDHARAAFAACVELGDLFRQVHALAVLADALAVAGSPEEAVRIRTEAREIAAELSGPDAEPLMRRLLLADKKSAMAVDI